MGLFGPFGGDGCITGIGDCTSAADKGWAHGSAVEAAVAPVVHQGHTKIKQVGPLQLPDARDCASTVPLLGRCTPEHGRIVQHL